MASPTPPADVAPSANGDTPRTDPRTASPAVACRALPLGYGQRGVLADIDLQIDRSAVTALIGPNGAGKSTLLHAIAGLLPPRQGTLQIPARARRGGVAIVLQATEANGKVPLTIREVVGMGRYPYHRLWGRLNAADRRAIDSALDTLEIRDLAGAQLQEVSGGQRQRALVAQGLAQDAELLLLDEPYTGLDVVSRASISAALEQEREKGRSVVLSTHDLTDAAEADQVVVLAGRVVASGPPDEILSADTLAAAYGGRLVQLDGTEALLDDPHGHR
jgi:ABC-type Mn2+/Zn2+ transport system ATPase subunit